MRAPHFPKRKTNLIIHYRHVKLHIINKSTGHQLCLGPPAILENISELTLALMLQ